MQERAGEECVHAQSGSHARRKAPNMNNRAFYVFISIILILGIVTGYELSKVPKLETFKLVNIAGLLYTMLAVILLSEMAASSPRWKKIAVAWVAPGVLWLHTIVPLGVFFWRVCGANFVARQFRFTSFKIWGLLFCVLDMASNRPQ